MIHKRWPDIVDLRACVKFYEPHLGGSRDESIAREVLAGRSYRAVGKDFNLSHDRIRCITFKTTRKIRERVL